MDNDAERYLYANNPKRTDSGQRAPSGTVASSGMGESPPSDRRLAGVWPNICSQITRSQSSSGTRYEQLNIAMKGRGIMFRIAILQGLVLVASATLHSRAVAQNTAPSRANPVTAGPPQEGVEVLSRGPIHEAFAKPTVRAPGASEVVPKEPPKPVEEIAPEMKPEGGNVQWIPGYWAWDDDSTSFIWVSGVYRVVPPGRHWVPGYWTRAGDGWQRVAGFWAAQASDQIELLPTPPDPPEESITPPPAEDSTFQPGCWIYSGNQWLWRPGFWTTNQADWMWTADSYLWTPGGYIFVDGYWDYPFRNRGLLFAPVSVEQRYWNRPGWSFRPGYVVNDAFLLSSLFVRPDHYYFGDYYDPRFAAIGFVPWTDHHYSRVADPTFSYYQWKNRTNPNWTSDLRQLYSARRADQSIRPPRTLAQQTTVPRGGVQANNLTHVTALTPLARVDHLKLQSLSQAQVQNEMHGSSQFREWSAQRGKEEFQTTKGIQPSVQPGELPKAFKMPLPASRPPIVKHPEGAPPPPRHPIVPRPEHVAHAPPAQRAPEVKHKY
jgi:WXXGXW repeat (2 copies)